MRVVWDWDEGQVLIPWWVPAVQGQVAQQLETKKSQLQLEHAGIYVLLLTLQRSDAGDANTTGLDAKALQ